jgi:hypothetical protein
MLRRTVNKTRAPDHLAESFPTTSMLTFQYKVALSLIAWWYLSPRFSPWPQYSAFHPDCRGNSSPGVPCFNALHHQCASSLNQNSVSSIQPRNSRKKHCHGTHPRTFIPWKLARFQSTYRVVGKLGYGGYSTVWLCKDLQLAYPTIKQYRELTLL